VLSSDVATPDFQGGSSTSTLNPSDETKALSVVGLCVGVLVAGVGAYWQVRRSRAPRVVVEPRSATQGTDGHKNPLLGDLAASRGPAPVSAPFTPLSYVFTF
jgi:hypothetical protein